MRRRDFIKVMAGSAAAWPLAARAQHSDRRRLGLLTNLGDAEIKGRIGPFLEELQRLGWTDGHNIQIDKRNGAANVDALRKQAAELVALGPGVILAVGTIPTTYLLQATRTVPIVFMFVIDPLGGGLVDDLSRPGGNVTGFMTMEYTLSGKWLELLKQIAPGVTRAAVLRDAASPSGTGQFAVIQVIRRRVEANQRERRARDRAGCRGFRGLREWRFGGDGEPAGSGSSRSHYHSCSKAQTTGDLFRPLFCRPWRINLVWPKF
jgi:putative tryptophan/tyrosine transport system substrate-binding protein